MEFRRGTTTLRHTGVKEYYGVGRIERGESEWWGYGKVWRSRPGCILLKQPGDVVRHLAHASPVAFSLVRLADGDVKRVFAEGGEITIAQLEPGDPRAAPFHRLLDASEASPLARDVALAEAVDALAGVSGFPSHTRPVRRARSYLRDRLGEPITLDELAAAAELDKYHLCRAFRAQIGLPPHAYLTHLRIARAKQLLRDGLRASHVALAVGFGDQSQLTRHFRRLVGTTPVRYAKG